MTFRGQIAELGFEIIDLHLRERLTALGYEFVKSKQVGFKKSIDDNIIEISFYKDYYKYIQGSFEEYEYPIIEIKGLSQLDQRNSINGGTIILRMSQHGLIFIENG